MPTSRPWSTSCETAGADITLHDHCESPVGRHVGAAAYRIVQEALTNSLKHAGVAHVEVTLSCTRAELHLLVVDDGHAHHGRARPSVGAASRG